MPETQICIIEYDPVYRDACTALLVELERGLIAIDADRLDILGEDYEKQMLAFELRRVAAQNGKCFLAVAEGSAVGLIMGVQREYSPEDRLDYACPKAGVITEFVVTQKFRSRAVGKTLLNRMEAYFAGIGCAYMFVDVFAYNEKGLAFYEREGYHPRMITAVKKL